MKRQIICAAAALCLAGLTRAELGAPKAGTARYSSGEVHVVYGLPANYIVSSQILTHAIAVSFSDKFGLVASRATIKLLDSTGRVIGEYSSNEPRPILSVGNTAGSAVAWLPSHHELIHWNLKTFSSSEVLGDLPGVVQSLQMQDASSVALLTATRAGELYRTIVSVDGGFVKQVSSLGESQDTAFESGGFLLFRGKEEWDLRDPEGLVKPLAIPASSVLIEQMSSHSLHLMSTTGKSSWVLRLTQAGELSELPAVQGVAK